MHNLLVLAASLVGGRAQACGAWDPQVTVQTLAGHESMAIKVGWPNTVPVCGTFPFLTYAVCWDKDTSTPPATPGAALACSMTGGPVTRDVAGVFIHRSDMEVGVRLFACQNSDCSDYYGLGAGESVTNDSGTTTTDPERWVFPSVADYADSSRTISDNYANASAAMFYPNGFGSTGSLGIWWSSAPAASGNTSTIYHQKAASSGWRDFNNTSWGSTSTVAGEPGASSSGAYGDATHPWVIPVDDGTDRYIRMFLHAGGSGSTPYARSVWRIDSVDEDGTDFGLECTNPSDCAADTDTCAYGDPCDWDGVGAVEELCGDESAGCDYLSDAGHGRVAWDYLANGAFDPAVDEPFMVITGEPPTPSCTYGYTPADLFLASWDATGQTWSVGTSGSCPVGTVADYHDPGFIPLPDDAFKMYYKEGLTAFWVSYWNGTTFEDAREIELAFDDATAHGSMPSLALGNCLDNIDTLVFPTGSGPKSGAFFKARTHPGSTGCFTGGGGILFAEHRN